MADESNTSSNVSLPIEATEATGFNIYGSPVRQPAREAGEVIEAIEAEVSTDPLPQLQQDALPQRVTCACKNTCSRKRTARSEGCPCRNAGQSCGENCKCGTKNKPCKNKRDGEAEPGQSNEPSALVRHQQDIVAAKKAIEEYVTPLSGDTKTMLLIRLLSQGRGSLDYAKNLVAEMENPDPAPEPRNTRLPWCICGVCEERQTAEENKCCKKVRCVTSYHAFHNQCIDQLSLTLAIRQRCDMRADLPDYSSNSYRKAAYRLYILWKYGKLGKGNRKVVPACVVRVVRAAYPAPDNIYMGYRAR